MAEKSEDDPMSLSTIVMLRWVLIIATSYLVIFNNTAAQTPFAIGLFVALYFASNILLRLAPRLTQSRQALISAVVLFDTFAASLGLLLTGHIASDFFLLYFLVIFLGALTNRLGLVVGAAVMSSVVHLGTVLQYVSPGELLSAGYLLRIPFLLVVAMFFGHLVSEEHRAREQVRADFLGMISHDLKNPISVIEAMSDLLLDAQTGTLQPDQRHLVERIHANAHSLLALSSNLVDAARIAEAGPGALNRTPESLVDIVEEALRMARPASEAKGIAVTLSAAPGLPPAMVDFTQMERVAFNLIDNAIKYTPAGGCIDVTVERCGEEAILTVADSGPGIPRDQIPLLFGKYRRLDTSRGVRGAGLGLFIVKTMIEAHGGKIEVESAEGQGTTMRVCLPLDAPKPSRRASLRHPLRPATATEI